MAAGGENRWPYLGRTDGRDTPLPVDTLRRFAQDASVSVERRSLVLRTTLRSGEGAGIDCCIRGVNGRPPRHSLRSSPSSIATVWSASPGQLPFHKEQQRAEPLLPPRERSSSQRATAKEYLARAISR